MTGLPEAEQRCGEFAEEVGRGLAAVVVVRIGFAVAAVIVATVANLDQ